MHRHEFTTEHIPPGPITSWSDPRKHIAALTARAEAADRLEAGIRALIAAEEGTVEERRIGKRDGRVSAKKLRALLEEAS